MANVNARHELIHDEESTVRAMWDKIPKHHHHGLKRAAGAYLKLKEEGLLKDEVDILAAFYRELKNGEDFGAPGALAEWLYLFHGKE